ncbi:MAG: Protein-export rane protein SecF [Ignavibacteria bacterium]|nr:Protein-export rane protein SecF [Ignavibacteria bacterium]
MQFLHGTKIDFVGKRLGFFIVSALATVIGVIAVASLGIEYGIDFEGGTEVAMSFSKPVQTDQLRSVLVKTTLKGQEIKSYGKEGQFLIRVKEAGDAKTIITEAYKKAFPDMDIKILKVDKIGPKIGSELRWRALLAVFISMIGILLYIAFRFEFIYGLGAIIALVHDVIFSFSMVVVVHHLGWINLEADQTMLAAGLTVVGFSINDTVIIFDRIRENLVKHKGMNYIKLVNLSINETLSRTIITVLTVVLVLLTMVVLGGPVLRPFSFIMLVGIIIGTYSSIYIASSYVIWHMESIRKVKFEGATDRKEAVKPANA